MPTVRSFDYAVIRVELDPSRLAALAPECDPAEVEHYLAFIPLVCNGDLAAGEPASWPPANRFHWLTAPRSTIIQTSPVHSGTTTDPQATLDRLFERMVASTNWRNR